MGVGSWRSEASQQGQPVSQPASHPEAGAQSAAGGPVTPALRAQRVLAMHRAAVPSGWARASRVCETICVCVRAPIVHKNTLVIQVLRTSRQAISFLVSWSLFRALFAMTNALETLCLKRFREQGPQRTPFCSHFGGPFGHLKTRCSDCTGHSLETRSNVTFTDLRTPLTTIQTVQKITFSI